MSLKPICARKQFAKESLNLVLLEMAGKHKEAKAAETRANVASRITAKFIKGAATH